jgi:hypothetical protein
MSRALNFEDILKMFVGRDSLVGIATRCGLDGPGIEIRWGARFFQTRPDRPWDPPSLLYSVYRMSLQGKAARALTTQPHLAPRLEKE